MEIEGVAALVTGAGSGMGEMTAQHLAGVGAKVSLVDLNEDRVRDVAKRVGGCPLSVMFRTRPVQRRRLLKQQK